MIYTYEFVNVRKIKQHGDPYESYRKYIPSVSHDKEVDDEELAILKAESADNHDSFNLQGHPGMVNNDDLKNIRESGHPVMNRYFNKKYNRENLAFSESFRSNPSSGSSSYLNYSYNEIFVLVVFIWMVYSCCSGRTFNDKYANSWYNSNKQYFERYSKLGIKPETEEISNTSELIKDSYNVYKYYAEEYKSINWILVILEFRKKQDAVSLISGLFFEISDKIYYTVSITPNEHIPNIFCICRGIDCEKLKKTYKDLVKDHKFRNSLQRCISHQTSADF